MCSFLFSYLGFVELLEFIDCFSSNLQSFLPLFLQTYLLSPLLSSISILCIHMNLMFPHRNVSLWGSSDFSSIFFSALWEYSIDLYWNSLILLPSQIFYHLFHFPHGPLLFSDLCLWVASLQCRLSHTSCLLGLIPWMRFCFFWDDLILISLLLWSMNSLRGGKASLLFISLTALGLSFSVSCPAARGILVPQPGIRPEFPALGS